MIPKENKKNRFKINKIIFSKIMFNVSNFWKILIKLQKFIIQLEIILKKY